MEDEEFRRFMAQINTKLDDAAEMLKAIDHPSPNVRLMASFKRLSPAVQEALLHLMESVEGNETPEMWDRLIEKLQQILREPEQ